MHGQSCSKEAKDLEPKNHALKQGCRQWCMAALWCIVINVQIPDALLHIKNVPYNLAGRWRWNTLSSSAVLLRMKTSEHRNWIFEWVLSFAPISNQISPKYLEIGTLSLRNQYSNWPLLKTCLTSSCVFPGQQQWHFQWEMSQCWNGVGSGIGKHETEERVEFGKREAFNSTWSIGDRGHSYSGVQCH